MIFFVVTLDENGFIEIEKKSFATENGMHQVVKEEIWLDATDSKVFGSDALQTNSTKDQSTNLQSIINQAHTLTKQLVIPAGTYVLEQSVTLKNGMKIKGVSNGSTILKNPTNKPVVLSDENYQTSQGIEISQIFFEGIGIFTRLANEIVINDNIFFHPVSLYPVNLQTSNGATLKNNIFMRDHEHATPDTENRAIYIGGFSTAGRYEYMENVMITDNLFGLKINELDAIKSFSNDSIIHTINRLQSAIENKEVSFNYNEQNYLSCGVNSYSNSKNILIKNNFFHQMYENKEQYGVVGDHAIYLRGSQSVQVISNHLRGLHNGPAGGFKFKSGRDITIMNNYLRNTGIIMYETPEFGLGENFEQGKVAELSNWLVANNIFDFKEWQERYAIGIEYNRHTGVDNVFNGVFIDNQFVNYHNIPSNRRRELLIMNRALEGFKGISTYVAGNTRDDIADQALGVEFWPLQEYQKMPDTWVELIDPTFYQQYKDAKVPIRNLLPIGLSVDLVLGETYDPFDFVDQTHDADEKKPFALIVNPDVLSQIGKHKLEIILTYDDGSEVRIFSTVQVITPEEEIDIPRPNTQQKYSHGQITFVENTEDVTVIAPEPYPEVIIPPEVSGTTGPLSIVKAISMDFGKQQISTRDQTYEMMAEMAKLTDGSGEIPYVSFIQVQDLRGNNEGWNLSASMSDFTSTTRNNQLRGVEVTFLDPRIQYEGSDGSNTPLGTGNILHFKPNTGSIPLMAAKKGTGSGTTSLIIGSQTDLINKDDYNKNSRVKNSNILLNIPGKSEQDATIYKSFFCWELSSVPENVANELPA